MPETFRPEQVSNPDLCCDASTVQYQLSYQALEAGHYVTCVYKKHVYSGYNCVSSIKDPHNDQLPAGLIAQMVEHCTSITDLNWVEPQLISCSTIRRLCLELLAGLPLKYLAIYVNLIDHNQALLCRQIVLECFDCMHGLADKQSISFDHNDDKQTPKLYIHSPQHNTLVTLIEHKPQVLKREVHWINLHGEQSRQIKSNVLLAFWIPL